MFMEVFVRAIAGMIHVAWVPFILCRGDGVDAPVNEDAKLGILVPLWLLVLHQRAPVRTERAFVRLPVGFSEKAIAFSIVLGYGLLPFLIDLLGRFDAECGSERVGCCGGRLGKSKWRSEQENCGQESSWISHTPES